MSLIPKVYTRPGDVIRFKKFAFSQSLSNFPFELSDSLKFYQKAL